MVKVIRADKSAQERCVFRFVGAANNSALTPDNSGAAFTSSRGAS